MGSQLLPIIVFFPYIVSFALLPLFSTRQKNQSEKHSGTKHSVLIVG